MGREVAESCVEGIVMEMVSAYCDRLFASKPDLAASRIEAIGYQVGLQLSERYQLFPFNSTFSFASGQFLPGRLFIRFIFLFASIMFFWGKITTWNALGIIV